MRKTRLSGIYYHDVQKLLDEQIRDAFTYKKGPGDLPVQPPKSNTHLIKGIIVPQYKYDLAAPCAAWGYKALAESGVPDVVIIVGQSENGSGISLETYETPYGMIRVDQTFANAVAAKGTITVKEELFKDDEAIPSQLPLLQFVYKSHPEVKILPLMLSTDIEFKKLAVDIKETLVDQNKKIAIIVPCNFTKYGRDYAYVPFTIDPIKNVGELDKGAFEFIEKCDPKGYLAYVDEKAMNTTNYLGIVFAMLLQKPHKVEIEQYYTSAEFFEDAKSFVSFATLVLK